MNALAPSRFSPIMEYFVREVARPGPVSNFDFTALLAKVASNVLMTCEHLRRHLKVSWSMLSISDFFSDPEFIKWRVRSTGGMVRMGARVSGAQ